MKQMQIAKELEPEDILPKQRIRQQLVGELKDGGLIELNGKAYVRFDDRDLFFELQGSGGLDEFFVFGGPEDMHTSDRLLMSAVRTVIS